jgi:tetratricopeptide (TPR) repeat protein
MGTLDDLPKRPGTHDTGVAAETAFAAAVEAGRLFLIQQRDRHDYGTDLVLEAHSGGAMTNLRVHVQLKGTEAAAGADGFVSVQVARTNLNYLLAQPHSVYVCFHIPTRRLLVRSASDVYRDYEHRGGDWGRQADVTVRFADPFDEGYQRRLHARVLASGRAARDRRLDWAATPPERMPTKVQAAVPAVEVPGEAAAAAAALAHLYEAGHDRVISNAFDQFAAVLGDVPGGMDPAYMAEINLGITGEPFDEARVRRGIACIAEAMRRGHLHPGSLLYCEANGWLALRDYEKASATYLAALEQLADPRLAGLAARCCKNRGSALESLGDVEASGAFFQRALEYDPDLSEAHLALGIWHLRHGTDVRLALGHLDGVVGGSATPFVLPTVHGWRIEALFRLGETEAAFREVQALRSHAAQFDWAWPYCARMVAVFGRDSVDAATRALGFWRAYLRAHPGDAAAERERLFCSAYLHAEGADPDTDFAAFRGAAVSLISAGDPEAALLWDRVGHWAQDDGDWVRAEEAFREAYALEPARYGYCLGTALNFLDRHAEALPILLGQAEEHQPDARSWFQVAVAREGTGDVDGCIAAYRRALALDPDYDLAWFNLGGVYWNSRDVGRARATWHEAVRRFPDHDLVVKLRMNLPHLFPATTG